jgi:glycosyltransferase involved in cell wall biosynthesis
MRVLIFRQNCGFNGITTWALDYGRALRARGVDVGFRFLGDRVDRFALFEAIGPTTGGTMASAMQHIEREPYDVVHVTSGDLTSLALTLPHSGAKLVATNQAQITGTWNSGNCHALTAISRDLALLEEPFTDLEIDTIYTGVSVDRFAPVERLNEERPIIAWIGRASDTKQKDFARFTRVASRLAREGFRIWVVDGTGKAPEDFTGDGYAPVAYDRWLTRVPIDDMPEIYRAIAASGGVLLMTSRFEGLGYVVLEAAACGAPTIGPDVVGLRNAIRPEIGAMFAAAAPDGDVASFIAEWIHANPRSMSRCAARTEFVASTFSIADMTDRYMRVYERSRPAVQQTRATLPAPLPAGAELIVPKPSDPLRRQRALWLQTSRDLVEGNANHLAIRALARAVRHEPSLLFRPSQARVVAKTAARAVYRTFRKRATSP